MDIFSSWYTQERDCRREHASRRWSNYLRTSFQSSLWIIWEELLHHLDGSTICSVRSTSNEVFARFFSARKVGVWPLLPHTGGFSYRYKRLMFGVRWATQKYQIIHVFRVVGKVLKTKETISLDTARMERSIGVCLWSLMDYVKLEWFWMERIVGLDWQSSCFWVISCQAMALVKVKRISPLSQTQDLRITWAKFDRLCGWCRTLDL